jgi:16S rRNA (guanine527-N7)-methyltransferase
VKQPELEDGLRDMGLAPTHRQLSTLGDYERILEGRGVQLGLVAGSDRDRIRTRHILDCARAAPACEGASDAYDLGSGGGLPGIVVAILAPDLRVVLAERRTKRAGFLEWACGELALTNTEVVAGDIGQLPPESADVCFARALAPLGQAWDLSRPLLRDGGRLVYFAGTAASIPGELLGARSIARLPAPTGVQATTVVERAGSLVIISR